jgi:hypothetical protein
MSFLKRLFEPPANRKRRELFTAAANQHGLSSVTQTDNCHKQMQAYATLQHSRLRETRVFSCWQSETQPVFQLVDYGTISASGGWQWTVLRFTQPIANTPDFVITGKGWLDKAGIKLGLSTAVNLPASAEFQQTYLIYSSNPRQAAVSLSPRRLDALYHLPLPKISSIELKNGILIYQQSLNFKSSNPIAFNPRQAQPADISQIIHEGLAVYQLFQ